MRGWEGRGKGTYDDEGWEGLFLFYAEDGADSGYEIARHCERALSVKMCW